MRVIATQPQAIKSSKTGAEYTKVGLIYENGTLGELFLSKSEYDGLNFPVTKCLSKEDVTEIFNKFETVEVDFDNRGRCIGAK